MGGGLSACRVIGFVLSLPHLYLHYAAPKIAAESGKRCGPEPVGIRPGVGSNVVPDLPKPPRCATQSSGPHVNWIAAGITQVLPSQSAEMMEWGDGEERGRGGRLGRVVHSPLFPGRMTVSTDIIRYMPAMKGCLWGSTTQSA